MSEILKIQKKLEDLKVVEDLARAFESVASLEIRQIKQRVLISRQFFHDLWGMYSQLRLDQPVRKNQKSQPESNKQVAVLITSERGLSGPIDQELVEYMIQQVNVRSIDVIVVGRRGVDVLASYNMIPTKVFPLPDISKPFLLSPLAQSLQGYSKVEVFYAQFISLSVQQITSFELQERVQVLTEEERLNPKTDLLYASDFIFEPDISLVITYLESMIRVAALSEIILEAQLAHLASRYVSMNQAQDSANKLSDQLNRQLNTAKRSKRSTTASVAGRGII